jgi:hypothetical protein
MNLIELFSVYGNAVSENVINSELSEITVSSLNKNILVCYKDITYGGGAVSQSRNPNERRIQVSSNNRNQAYNALLNGETAILIGISDSDDVFCAWKLDHSNATHTISKQIKIQTIEEAAILGFAQQKQHNKDEYSCAFRKDFIYFYIENLEWIHDMTVGKPLSYTNNADESQRITGGNNYLLYGVPGSGKSHTIKTQYCDDESLMERVVFHPDYTYSDFIGQIMPKTDENGCIRYEFSPGPFTRMLYNANNDPTQEYFLVIEELNRGNAPAIFGEIFQLLDRNEEPDEGTIGESSYGITNTYIADFVYGNPNKLVFIPSNLSIIATMNTSDQNVFTLDTAFQRRWRMRMIENNINQAEHADKPILDTDITWKQFNDTINDRILTANSQLTSSEDKRLGAYFVTSADLDFSNSGDDKTDKDQNSRFPEKVLKYLWDDAFKFTRSEIFDTDNCKSLETVIKLFRENNGNERFKAIFNDSLLSELNLL